MHKVGFLITNKSTTDYYKQLYEKLEIVSNIELHWINLEIVNTNVTRKISLLNKLISYLNSKLLNLISKIERHRSVYFNNLNFLKSVKINDNDVSLTFRCILKIPSNRLTLIDEDRIKFSDYGFDLIVRSSFGILDSTFLNVSKKGVISLHLGDNRKIRGSMPGFYEAVHKYDEIGYIIQRINNNLDGGDILFRANFPAKNRWNDNHLFIIGMSFDSYFKTILNVINDRITYSELKLPYFNKLNLAPSLNYTFKYLFVLMRDTFMSKLSFYFNDRPSWHVHFTKGNWDNAKFYNSKVIENNLDSFFADPFPINFNSEQYLFVEEYLIKKNKGVISVLKYDGKVFQYLGIVLDLPFHLSFPFLYQDTTGIYMIPEQAQSNYIGLYRAVDFPFKWELHIKLIENVDAADTIIFKYKDKFWLFTNIDSNYSGIHLSELHIYYSNELGNTWTPHPQNVHQKISPFGKRNASEIFIQNGKLFRFGQIQGNSFYGKGIALFEIVISETDYVESYVSDYYPNFSSKMKGLHHISTNNNFTFVDCYY